MVAVKLGAILVTTAVALGSSFGGLPIASSHKGARAAELIEAEMDRRDSHAALIRIVSVDAWTPTAGALVELRKRERMVAVEESWLHQFELPASGDEDVEFIISLAGDVDASAEVRGAEPLGSTGNLEVWVLPAHD